LQAVLVLIALAASGLAARFFYKKQFFGLLEARLNDALELESRNIPNPVPADWCVTIAKNTPIRFTLIRADGTPLCDSISSLDDLGNLLDRPEVQQALSSGRGRALRQSRDIHRELYYEAMMLPHRDLVLRVALPLSDFYSTVELFDTSLGLVLTLFAILFAIFAVWSGRKLVFPIGRLLLKTQRLLSQSPEALSKEEVGTDFFGEWSELESNIDDIRRDLEAKAQSLDAERVELATIMAAISDAILAVDPEGIPLFYNSRFQVLFGGEALRERNVKLWEIFRDPEILEAFSGALRDGRVADTRTIAWEQADGIKRYFSLSVAPLRRQNSTIYGAVGIFHDVSELKSAEQMRIDFVANVSHELRTPLTSIKGYAETLIHDVDSSKPVSKEFLNIIARNSNRLMNLMEDLLDLSSIESDHILQREQLSTDEVTSRVLKQLIGRFESKGQKVETTIKEPKVFADPGRLEQVLVNLLDNAHKYTPPNGKVMLSWEREGSDVLLKITDTGPGIPLEHQHRLFERFYRVDKARSREQGGTGLGLAIVKHIMQRHEGRVWVESRSGQGATFICRFPGGN
jgi:two-component system phosphate regulon sensor histidine kinase PhoR